MCQHTELTGWFQMDNYDFRPKYIKISEDIKKEMRLGIAGPGSKVYSEKEIVDKYSVSTTTARKALDFLKTEGLIERIQGKGTFVKPKKVIRSLRKVLSFTENMEKQNITPSVKLLEKKVLSNYTKYHKKLNLNPGDEILKIRRVKYGDGIPLLVDARAINLKICPGIANRDLTGSLYKIYEDYNIKITKTKQFLELVFLNEEEGKLLGCKKSDPAIYIEGVLSMENEIPLEYEEDLWNANAFKFYLEASL